MRLDELAVLLNEDAALAVDLVDDPEQRHHLAGRDWTSAPGRAASPISRANGGCGEQRLHDKSGIRREAARFVARSTGARGMVIVEMFGTAAQVERHGTKVRRSA